jgi:BASS family bile acid:Na+ symporter
LLSPLLRILSWIGRHGTQGFALSIFLGLALPQFAAAARPLLAVCIFVFITITFLRVDLAALRRLARAPGPLALSSLWALGAPVVLVVLPLLVIGRDSLDPGLVLGLAIVAGAPPIMSAPAVAMLFGIEPTLLLATVVLTTVIAPLVSPLIVEFVAGAAVPLDVGILTQRLLFLIGGATLTSIALRKLLGEARIRRHKQSFDGIGVCMYFLFAVAAMDGVVAAAMADPWRVASFLAVAFVLAFAGFALAWVLMRPLPGGDRFVLGYATGQRNMGLLVAALGAATPDTTFLYFALAQFPIYLMPQLVKPLALRIAARPQGVAPAGSA